MLALASGRAQLLPPAERDAFIQKFIAKQSATTTFQAGLEQTLQLQGLREPVTSTGRIYFRAPDGLALRFSQPAGEFVIIDGDDLYMQRANRPLQHHRFDPTGARGQGGQMRFLLDLFQHGATNTLAHYNAAITRTNDQLVVSLTPKQPQPHSREPSRIDNGVSLPDLELRSMRVEFENQSALSYQFLDPVRNQPLDAAVFRPPREEH